MQLTIALAAEEAAGAQALRMVVDRGHRVAAVFSEGGRGALGAGVADVASQLGVPVHPADAVREPGTADELRAAGVDLLLNVHSLHIVDPGVLDAPGLGSYNLHPGPLPERAGLDAPSWALYEGASEHGVTLHRMTAAVDQGPIAFVERFAIGPRDTALTLMTACARRGLALVERLLAHAERGDPIPAEAQDPATVRWFGRGPPEDGRLRWSRTAREVAGFVRACDFRPFPSPWGFPRCTARRAEIAVLAVEPMPDPARQPAGTVVAVDGDDAVVAAADTLVRVRQLELTGSMTPPAAVLEPGERLSAGRSAAPAG